MSKSVRFGVWLAVLVLIYSAYGFAADVTGTVKFSGTAPEREPLSMAADPTCLAAHPDPVLSENVIVNSNGTLRNVFVYVKEGLQEQTAPAPTTPVTLDQKGCQYSPHVFGIQVGQPLEIINSDNTLHNVHSLAEKSKQFNLGMPLQGMKVTKKYESPEIMAKFKCDVHPWMNAYAGVLNHPFFAVTGEDGSFTIKDLPPGSYVLEAWHEQYGTQTQNITVPGAAEFTFQQQ